MSINRTRRAIIGAFFSLILLFGSVAITSTTAQAQGRGRGHDRHWSGGRGDWNRGNRGWRGNNRFDFGRQVFPRTRTRVFVAPRFYPRTYSYPYAYTYPRTFVPYSYGGTYFGSNTRGYSDGFDRGREDAQDGRSYNPNNSSHFRNGSFAYRDAFRRGYDAGYRQYSGYWRR
jgi:hypothetical protein